MFECLGWMSEGRFISEIPWELREEPSSTVVLPTRLDKVGSIDLCIGKAGYMHANFYFKV